MLKQLLEEIKRHSSPVKAKSNSWFFKTGPGEYGEGDVFVGLTVPQMRKLAKKYADLEFPAIQKMLDSKYHEYRFIALEILVFRYEKEKSAAVVKFYLRNTKRINNWDLVDTSAPYILGEYLVGKPRDVLYRLARSSNLWERRIAIVSTFAFIRKTEFQDALKIAQMLLTDKHDLIHKAVGWMLREIGKKDFGVEKKFLDAYYKSMPRTALRYAIERFPQKLRAHYMKK